MTHAFRHAAAALLPLMPPVRGQLSASAPVGKQTWFGVGGGAEVLFRPADTADLVSFLSAVPAEIPVTAIGVGSNLLVRDGGIGGVVVRLGRAFAGITIAGSELRVGAAALDRIVARAASDAGLGGLEFLSGIPGSIGGSVRMNAGAYGREIKDVLLSATALDRSGAVHHLDSRAMGFSYRHSGVDPGWIFVEARLRGAPGERTVIATRLSEIRAAREATQPVRARTGGSTFRNPPGEAAWRLIDAAGCRGLVRGGAKVSEQHTNFLINTGGASAADLEGLGEEVRRRVFAASGITLEWEIERIGQPLLPFGLAEGGPGRARCKTERGS
ncbi:MAG: UDP-N-acetylmuramate dehydrogenase [Alphaproteobacteria bacterium]|nr:UDP-N-acetylmuramate dehydrogenase [Alphaproteobacteria bacterium]